MEEKDNFNLKRTAIVLFSVCMVLGILLVLYQGFWKVEDPVETYSEQKETFYRELLKKNEAFSQGEVLFKSGSYVDAVAQYERALETAEGAQEEGQLKYKMGISYVHGGKPIEGIAILKEVVANKNYTPRIRAYAVQLMGNMLYSYNTEEVRKEVFKGNPYKRFLEKAQGNQGIAERKLFEYASSLYPLGVSEMRIAKWHSEKVVRLSGREETDEIKKKIEDAKSVIREKLASVDTYILDIASDEQERVYLAEVWRRKAAVLGDMLYAGDTTFPSAEGAYKTALQFSLLNMGDEGAAKYSYAVFLANMYGDERASDIQGLLSDFYTTNKYSQTGIVRMIQNEKDGLSGNKKSILLLANTDSRFLEYLKTLGWDL